MTICNVRDFGAAGNRQALDTAAIQAAIDAAGRCNGQVRVPAGKYLSGSLMLRSGVSLHLEAGASVVASHDMRHFVAPAPDSYVHHTGSRFAFIHAIGAADVHILGSGTIDGNLALDGGHRGPLPLLFENCRRLRVEGISVVDSPGWAVTFWGCRHVTVAGVQILNSFADGLNPCCCQDVLIEDVAIDDSGDDPVCLKNDSHRYAFATRPECGFVSRDITIRRVCIRGTSHPAFKIGTGTHGVFQNIEIADCRLENTGALFCVQLMRPTYRETPRRAIEGVHVHDIRGDGVAGLLDLTSMDVSRCVVDGLRFRRIHVAKVTAPSRIHGLADAPIRNITLRDVTLEDPADGAPWLHGRFMDGLSLQNVRIGHEAGSEAGMLFQDSRRLRVEGLQVDGAGTGPPVLIRDSRDVCLAGFEAAVAGPLVSVEGESCGAVDLAGLAGRGGVEAAIAGGIPNGAVVPAGGPCRYSDLQVPPHAEPGRELSLSAALSNEGRAGFVKTVATVDGQPAGGRWLWLGEGESRTVRFRTERLYKGGLHEVRVAECVATTRIAATPARFRFLEPVRVVPGSSGRRTFSVEVRNVGGESGSVEVPLEVDGIRRCSRTVTLDSGEKREVGLSIVHGEEAGHARIGGREWPWLTFTNTPARFSRFGERIEVTAGGGLITAWDATGAELASAYTRVRGDFDVSVLLETQDPTGPYAAAGLIVRNRIARTPVSPGYLMLCVCPKYGGLPYWGADLDGDGVLDTKENFPARYPIWFRIRRTGHRYAAWTSLDGTSWRAGRVFQVSSAADAQDVGVFASAYSAKGELGRAVFSRLELEPAILPRPASCE
ncbi:MAG: glycosyl hydrolase family 28-related protein [Spirochaetaceae bacterium]|nr:glycosyl hydrolase family 28-related protein [Spirochaetaceae bacterium]